jgi:hypothetical protein
MTATPSPPGASLTAESLTPAATGWGRPGLRRVHLLLAVQSIVIVLLSINRLSSWTQGPVAANEFLRWVDFHNMLTLPLASLVAFYLLKKHLEMAVGGPAQGGRWHLALGLTFIVGAYLLGAGYGDHEVTNYLHARFCASDPSSDLCRIVIFNDDEFSHWVFFLGFILINAVMMLLQALFPYPIRSTARDNALLIANGLFIGLGIFANLAFEAIGLDLYVVALLAVLAVALLRRRGPEPLLVYYTTAYVLGLAATFAYKASLGSL